MRIAGVLGILFLVYPSEAQIEDLLGLDLASIYDNVATIEKAFGSTLTEKLVDAAHEAYEGTFTITRLLDWLEGLTSEEKDNAVQGIIVLVQELEKVLSAPGTADQLRMGFTFAPMVLRQVINSMPAEKSEEPEDEVDDEIEPKKVEEVVVKIKPNETELNKNDNEEGPEEIDLMGNLMGPGMLPDGVLEVMEQFLSLAEEYNEADLSGEGAALDDELYGIKDKPAASEDEIGRAKRGEKSKEHGIKEEAVTKEESGTSGNGKDEL